MFVIVLTVVGGILFAVVPFSTSRVIEQIVEQPQPNNAPPEALRASGRVNPWAAAAKLRLTGQPFALAENAGLGVQMLVATVPLEGGLLIGFDPTTQQEVWRSPPLSDRTAEWGVASDAQRVYIADGADLLTLDRQSGKLLWQTSLANNLQSSCPAQAACLQAVGGHVVALTRDGTLQAFAGATGAPLWSRRLDSTPRRLMVAQNEVLVFDTDAANGVVVMVLEGAPGDVQTTIIPTCDDTNFHTRAAISDEFLLSPSADALIVLGSGSYACAWRFGLPEGSEQWRYESQGVESTLPFAWAFGSVVFAEPMAYFIDETNDPTQIWALDTLTGSMPDAPLYTVDGYDLTLLQATPTQLLVAAAPGYAQDEVELWAIDRTSGTRLWQRRLETTHSFDDWLVFATEQEIFVTVCFWNKEPCRFLVLDPQTGVTRADMRPGLAGSLAGGIQRGPRAFLTIDGALHAVDLASAEIVYTWPP
jgi:outer membrane protein assembly factor BamB